MGLIDAIRARREQSARNLAYAREQRWNALHPAEAAAHQAEVAAHEEWSKGWHSGYEASINEHERGKDSRDLVESDGWNWNSGYESGWNSALSTILECQRGRFGECLHNSRHGSSKEMIGRGGSTPRPPSPPSSPADGGNRNLGMRQWNDPVVINRGRSISVGVRKFDPEED